MKRYALYVAASFAAMVLAVAAPGFAQEESGSEDGISAYAVARVKVLDGTVWVRPSGDGDWEEYPSNSPLPPRSRISVPEGSEAELQFHGGQFVLLTSGTDLEVRDLKEKGSAFRLRAGEIRFDLPSDDFAPVSVRIPGGAIARFPVPGRQWLTVTDTDETRLVVRRGEAVISDEGDEHRLRAGDEAMIGRDISIGRYQGGADESAEALPSQEETGVEDVAPPVVVDELRDYGEWIDVPTYGTVWRPRVAAGWSPYVYGRWVWISPYGWTWVSYEPWGWYPYRCGYWVTDPIYGWLWSPYNAFLSVDFVFGSNRYHHYGWNFRPATVRFIPEGRSVRWVPLRPGERYRPVEYSRGDTRLAQWNRPLESGRVFVRSGSDHREWRDWSAVHSERQAEIRKTRSVQQRPDTRTIRPEIRGTRTPASVDRKGNADSRGRGEAVRQPKNRPAPGENRGSVGPREYAPTPGNSEQRTSPGNVPSARPPARERLRDEQPRGDRSVVRPSTPPDMGRGVVQEPSPVERRQEPGTRGQEMRDYRGGGGDRGGGDRGDDRGVGGRGR